jgi:hypothetical protein
MNCMWRVRRCGVGLLRRLREARRRHTHTRRSRSSHGRRRRGVDFRCYGLRSFETCISVFLRAFFFCEVCKRSIIYDGMEIVWHLELGLVPPYTPHMPCTRVVLTTDPIQEIFMRACAQRLAGSSATGILGQCTPSCVALGAPTTGGPRRPLK